MTRGHMIFWRVSFVLAGSTRVRARTAETAARVAQKALRTRETPSKVMVSVVKENA